jgi:palmitoyl-protein thioesterase
MRLGVGSLASLATTLLLRLSESYALPPGPHNIQAKPRPLVIWHGLGDSYGAPGILRFMDEIKAIYPGIFIHSVHLAESQDDDRRASFVSSLN